MADRLVCDGCNQELSRSAFYRHKNFPVCPGKMKSALADDSVPSTSSTQASTNQIMYEELNCEYPEYEESESSSNDEDNNESTVEVIGEDEISESDNSDNDNIDDQGIICNTYNSSHDEESVQQNAGSNPNETPVPVSHSQENIQATINPIIKSVSHFLLFLQLKFRIADRAIHYFLLCLKGLLSTLLTLTPENKLLSQLYKSFPYTLYGLKKSLSTTWKSSVTEYVACAKCSTLTNICNYTLAVRRQAHNDIPKCLFIEFPNHPQISRRQKCNSPLFKQIKFGSKYKLVPSKVFLYKSIIESLRGLINKPGMLHLCNKWVNHITVDGTLNDISDGKMWKDFLMYDGEPFLDLPNNIALALNIDWFNPYKHTQYSIGAVYLTILNLPRTQRYKIENTIIVGLIPGPNEPKRINTFLKPIIDELIQLWYGVKIIESANSSVPTLRAVLHCFVSDIPATRKICGFPSFNAKFGCSKCLKTFSCEMFSGPTDYSGYDRQNWKIRTPQDHKAALEKIRASTTLTEQRQLQRKYGVHYSELNRLPYYNIIRGHVIDPMHNMYLGTAKHVMKIWRECGVIHDNDLAIIQQRVDEFNIPHNIGRILHKISSNFSGLTADQWLNWTNLYSIYALKDILSPNHMQCWSYFVKASIILRQYTLTEYDLNIADENLLQFCQEFQRLYGKEKCTPNMHLHNHLKDCILDYGPISTFWTFPFERFNGLLESFSKNWVNPEEQILQKIINYQDLKTTLPEFSVMNELYLIDDGEGSVQQTQVDTQILQQYKNNATCPVNCINALRLDIHNIPSKVYERFFTDDEVDSLKIIYTLLYPDSSIPHIPKCHLVFNDLEVLGEHYLSSKSQSQRSNTIMAKWYNSTGPHLTYKVGQIEYFFSHTVAIYNPSSSDSMGTDSQPAAKHKKSEHLFAKLNWLTDHQRPCHFPFPLYLASTAYTFSPYMFIPVSRLLCRCGVSPKLLLKFDYGEDYVFIVSPCLLANATVYRRI